MKQLKTYLTINSIFSALSGFIMIFFRSELNELFAILNIYVFPFIGFNLLAFSAFVLFVSIKKPSNKILVRAIAILDLLWVLGSFIIIALGLFGISTTGKFLMGIVAIWIGFLAYKQYKHSK